MKRLHRHVPAGIRALPILLAVLLSWASVLSAQEPPPSAAPLPPPLEVSDEELAMFAGTLIQIQDLGLETQQRIADRVEESELSNERFLEIFESDQILGAGEPQDITDVEQTEYDAVMVDIEVMQRDYEGQVDVLLEQSGLSIERFDEIYYAAQYDTSLQERLRPLLEPAVPR